MEVEKLSAEREFKAAPGAGFGDAEAQKYGTYLEKKCGLGRRVVPPEEVVEKARSERSPIHRYFTWDDTAAARDFRIIQARTLINHILIVVEDKEGVERQTRAFHNVITQTEKDEPRRGYISQTLVWERPEFADQVVARALRELRGWRERYRTYEFLQAAGRAVDKAIEELAA